MTRGYFIILILVFSVGCGGAPTAETTGSIAFTLERTIGRDVVLAFPRRVATLGDGTVLVVDGVTIHRFSPDGRHMGQFGELGSGPEEFESLSTMVVNMDDEVLAWDPRSRRVSFWSGTGDFQRSQPFVVPTSILSILPTQNGYTMAYALRPRDGDIPYWLHDYGFDLQQPVRHHTAYELAALSDIGSPLELFHPGFIAQVQNGYVWVPQLYDGNVIHIDADGKESIFPGMSVSGTLIEEVITGDEGNMSVFKGGVKEGTHLRIRYSSDGLFSMPGGGLLHVVSVDSYRSNPDSHTEVALFDGDLEISATRSLTRADSLGTPLHMDATGRLYTVRTEPEPHIAVWRVEYHAE